MTKIAADQHTSGPWEVQDTFSTHNAPRRYWETCVLSPQGYVAQSNGATEEEAIANASLIAAAPEMLEALEAVMRFCKTFPGEVEVAVKKARGF